MEHGKLTIPMESAQQNGCRCHGNDISRILFKRAKKKNGRGKKESLACDPGGGRGECQAYLQFGHGFVFLVIHWALAFASPATRLLSSSTCGT